MATIAENVIKPKYAGIFRSVFIYTGQGQSTLMAIPTGPKVSDYLYILIDSDQDKEKNEVDLVAMFKDLFKNGGGLSVFINTHPHNDHIGGIKQVYDEIGFTEVWHSNHKPGRDHREKYEGLQYVIKKVGKHNEYFLLGTIDPNKIRTSSDQEVIRKLGNVDFVILSPAEYLCDEINEEDQDTRDKMIHTQCGVIKFTYGSQPKSILITGDSDKAAWQDHITNYHKNKLPSEVLSASHHGSRTFFKNGEEDVDVYESHIQNISPTYVIISAPKQDESPYGHPHDDAIKLYEKYVGSDGILHLGSGPFSVIVDIYEDGSITVNPDEQLIQAYSQGNDEEDSRSNQSKSLPYIIPQTTRIDEKPMGK